MDTSGNLYESIAQEQAREVERETGRPLIPLTKKQHDELGPLGARQRKNHMRNQPCVCGSGKKFKRCCWERYA